MVAEIFTTGIFLIFFGVGAVIVGILVLAGMGGPVWMEWLLFSIISVVSLVLFRRPLMRKAKLNEHTALDTMIGEKARALEDIVQNAKGRAELRGSAWSAKNVGTQTIGNGQMCTVEAVDGIVLMVRAD
jgi:membrane protein implicated in regulation of membrane protease activity